MDRQDVLPTYPTRAASPHSMFFDRARLAELAARGLEAIPSSKTSGGTDRRTSEYSC